MATTKESPQAFHNVSRPNKTFPPPSAHEVQSGWLQVDICMRLAFSYYVWQKHFEPPNDASDECRFMRFAALQCTLLNIRAIDEFFRPQKMSNDICAAHYPKFVNPGTFLSDQEAKQIHQLIAHLTYRRFHEFNTTFPTFVLLSKAYDRFKAFMDYMHNVDFAAHVNVQAAIISRKHCYEKWLSEMSARETANQT